MRCICKRGVVVAAKYRLTRLLGKGGMGSVWEAEDLTLERHVAVELIALRLPWGNDEPSKLSAAHTRSLDAPDTSRPGLGFRCALSL